MTALVVNDPFLSQLRQAKEMTELRDAEGNVVGIFTPLGETDPSVIDWAEVDRRAKLNDPGRPIAPLLARMRELENEKIDVPPDLKRENAYEFIMNYVPRK